MKKTANQIRQPIHPSRKPRSAQKPPHQAEFVQDKARTFKITAERQHRSDGNGNDFGIVNLNARIFSMSAWLEKIVNKTVYCKSAMAHLVVLFYEIVWRQNSKRGLFSFQTSMPITGNLG
jgi:hypothetical protein